jgi:hypothetical protein
MADAEIAGELRNTRTAALGAMYVDWPAER